MASGEPVIAGLGPPMSSDDAAYLASEARKAGFSGSPSLGNFPGFDPRLLQSPAGLLGRWVRSPSKFVNWDSYMEFFGLSGDKALQETEEPQEHVILSFSRSELRILHRLPWRDGLDCEYTVPIDGSAQPVPPAMVARASSSWKVNDLMNWTHSWDDGSDGNPLHIGLRTEQKLNIAGTTYALRYWRMLIRPDEMRINVEVTYADTGRYAVHTQRFFRKSEPQRVYAAMCVAPGSGMLQQLSRAAAYTHDGVGVRIAVLPHASNMPEDWGSLAAEQRWQHAEEWPAAGRSSGRFLSQLRATAQEAGIWVCCGLVFRDPAAPHGSFELLRAVALVGADGWLHGVHCDMSADVAIFKRGAGDWPATQQARPHGVYDTELGRMAMCAAEPSREQLIAFARMGAELVLVPPASLPAGQCGRAVVGLPAQLQSHPHYTRYQLCGPDPDPCEPASGWPVTVLSSAEDGKLVSTCCVVASD